MMLIIYYLGGAKLKFRKGPIIVAETNIYCIYDDFGYRVTANIRACPARQTTPFATHLFSIEDEAIRAEGDSGRREASCLRDKDGSPKRKAKRL
jgi:phage gp45-like